MQRQRAVRTQIGIAALGGCVLRYLCVVAGDILARAHENAVDLQHIVLRQLFPLRVQCKVAGGHRIGIICIIRRTSAIRIRIPARELPSVSDKSICQNRGSVACLIRHVVRSARMCAVHAAAVCVIGDVIFLLIRRLRRCHDKLVVCLIQLRIICSIANLQRDVFHVRLSQPVAAIPLRNHAPFFVSAHHQRQRILDRGSDIGIFGSLVVVQINAVCNQRITANVYRSTISLLAAVKNRVATFVRCNRVVFNRATIEVDRTIGGAINRAARVGNIFMIVNAAAVDRQRAAAHIKRTAAITAVKCQSIVVDLAAVHSKLSVIAQVNISTVFAAATGNLAAVHLHGTRNIQSTA